MPGLEDTDPIAVVLPYLLAREDVQAVLGTTAARVGDHITDANEPPYPHVRLVDPPGNDRDLRHLVAPMLQVESLGDLDGQHDKPLLRRILAVVVQAIADLPDLEFAAGVPVVTSVRSVGGIGWAPEPTGQPRYVSTLQLHVHPPYPIPTP